MQEEEVTDQKLTAAYNESINQLYRINNLWQKCNDYSSSGHLVKWKWTLDAMWRELSADADRLDENIDDNDLKWRVRINNKANIIK